MSPNATHPLATAYLDALRTEAARLPGDQAVDLVDDIRAHLDSALGPTSSEADVRDVLGRLGSPREVVDAAAPPAVPAADPHEGAPITWGGVEIGALVALIASELLFFVFFLAGLVWVVGIVLALASRLWTRREKWLALLALGTGFPVALIGGFFAVAPTGGETCSSSAEGATVSSTGRSVTHRIAETCTGGGTPGWVPILFIGLAVAYYGFQLVTLFVLIRARRRAA